jgi:hypothetical protein
LDDAGIPYIHFKLSDLLKSFRLLIVLCSFAAASLLSSCHPDCLDCFVDCHLEPDPGICLAYFPKYYFSQETGQCEQFIWGGCGGVVPFDTLEECQACGCN